MASSMAILGHFNDLLDSSVRKMNCRRILYRNMKELAPFYLEKVGNGRIVGRYLEGRGESEKVGFFVRENRGVDGLRVMLQNKRVMKEEEESEEEKGWASPKKRFQFNSEKSTE